MAHQGRLRAPQTGRQGRRGLIGGTALRRCEP
jgi:hypothetical protein